MYQCSVFILVRPVRVLQLVNPFLAVQQHPLFHYRVLCSSYFFLTVRHFFTCKATFQTRASPVQPLAGTLPLRLSQPEIRRGQLEKQLLGTCSLSLVSSAPPRRAGSPSCSDFTVRTPGPVCRNRVLVQWQRWWGKWGPSSPVSLSFASVPEPLYPLSTA